MGDMLKKAYDTNYTEDLVDAVADCGNLFKAGKTKRWQDKTDEEVRLDVRKMVIKGKLTPWNEWDYITTVAEAKDYVEAIYEEWDKESQAANDCIVEILESYMEVLNLFEATMRKDVISQRVRIMADTLCKQRKEQWKPILDKAKKMQKVRKSAKKSA